MTECHLPPQVDPLEQTNIIREQPAVYRSLLLLLQQHIQLVEYSNPLSAAQSMRSCLRANTKANALHAAHLQPCISPLSGALIPNVSCSAHRPHEHSRREGDPPAAAPVGLAAATSSTLGAMSTNRDVATLRLHAASP